MAALRPYQSKIAAEIDRLQVGARALLVAPTGSGKTVMASAVISSWVERFQNVLVIAHRREIVNQTVRKLAEHGVFAGTIMAGAVPNPMRQVQVAAVQTLYARAVRANTMELPPADLVVVDEAHHILARTWQDITDRYPDAILLGMTATPCRGDGRGLGNIFDSIIECPQVAELVEQGYLVKSRVYAPINPDLSGVKTQNGDYVVNQLSDRINTDRLVGDIVTHWYKFGERRSTVVFAVDVKHSVHIADEFIKAGVRAEHLDGSTPTTERDAILARLASGETEVVSNCMVLTEGFDCPEIGCLVLARPTKQLGLFRQMVGRALRPAKGKDDAIILDHSGAVFRHGLPDDHVHWTLDTDMRASNPTHEKRGSGEHGGGLLECSQCGTLRLGGQPCPHCGFLPKKPARYVAFSDGDLALVGSKAVKASLETKRQWYGMLTAIQSKQGYRPGWVAHKYREKFGEWPPFCGTTAKLEPTPEVLAWVRSRNIAYAKARGDAA